MLFSELFYQGHVNIINLRFGRETAWSSSKCLFWFWNVLEKKIIYLKDRVTEKQRDFPSADLLSKWLQWLGMSQANRRSQKLHPGLPDGCTVQGLGAILAVFPDTLSADRRSTSTHICKCRMCTSTHMCKWCLFPLCLGTTLQKLDSNFGSAGCS